MKHLLLAILLPLMVVGCKSVGDRQELRDSEFVIIDPERIPALSLNEVEWDVWEVDGEIYYVLTASEADKLFTNLIKISDTFSKSREVNTYYRNSVDEYRESLEREDEE